MVSVLRSGTVLYLFQLPSSSCIAGDRRPEDLPASPDEFPKLRRAWKTGLPPQPAVSAMSMS